MNEEGRSGLWNFIGAHFSMISKVEGDIFTDRPLAFLLEDADIRRDHLPLLHGPYCGCGRAFIAQYPFKPDTSAAAVGVPAGRSAAQLEPGDVLFGDRGRRPGAASAG